MLQYAYNAITVGIYRYLSYTYLVYISYATSIDTYPYIYIVQTSIDIYCINIMDIHLCVSYRMEKMDSIVFEHM